MSPAGPRRNGVAPSGPPAATRARAAVLPAVPVEAPAVPAVPGALPRGRVLLVEDDDGARRALHLAVSDDGWEVVEAAGGREALRSISQDPDVVLLDLALPDMDGLEVLTALRTATDVPVIIVTGRSDSRAVTTGLRLGADDYVTKPVVASELTARIHALLRRARSHAPGSASEVRLGSLVLHPDQRAASKDGRELSLTRTEFRLLCELAATPDQVVTREQLLVRVWGYDFFGDTRLLDVHVRRLRLKVEDDPGNPDLVRTVRGVGYLLRASDRPR